jgi:hypothetical protein
MAVASDSSPDGRRPIIRFHVKKWQAALILLAAIIMALILLAIFVIPTARIVSQRIGEHTETMQNPVSRAEFIHISSELVQENRGLREALSCADIHHEANLRAPGYAIPMDPACDMKISWFDFEMIKREIPHSLDRLTWFKVEYDGKYYWIVHLLA